VRVVAEFAEQPGTQDGSQAGLGQVDLSVRVLAKIRLHLPLQDLDLLIQVMITAIRDRTVAA
jgi:hypothetical protein